MNTAVLARCRPTIRAPRGSRTPILPQLTQRGAGNQFTPPRCARLALFHAVEAWAACFTSDVPNRSADEGSSKCRSGFSSSRTMRRSAV